MAKVSKSSKVLLFVGLFVVLLVLIIGGNFLIQQQESVLKHAVDNFGQEMFFELTTTAAFNADEIPYQIDIDRSTTKLVLLFTDFFQEPNWKNFFNEMPANINYNHDNKKCRFMTRNQLRVDEADAVVFHGPDIDYENIPWRQRTAWQRWVYFALEAPLNLHFDAETNLAKVNKLAFNWTMSFSRKSDIWYPYGKFQPLALDNDSPKYAEISARTAEFKRSFSKRKHDAIWIVSNCRTRSNRENVAKKLGYLGLEVHIVGGCGSGHEFNESVSSLDYSQYRYFFAFENTLCEDYVTEKAFHAYDAARKAGVIPVVFGGARYVELLPPDSFIDVMSFKNVPELGDFLQRLSANNDSYYRDRLDKLYKWQLTTDLQNYDWNFTNKHYVSRFGWQALCEKLWTSDKISSLPTTIPDISIHFGSCRTKSLDKAFFNLTTRELIQIRLVDVFGLDLFQRIFVGGEDLDTVIQRLDAGERNDTLVVTLRELLDLT